MNKFFLRYPPYLCFTKVPDGANILRFSCCIHHRPRTDGSSTFLPVFAIYIYNMRNYVILNYADQFNQVESLTAVVANAKERRSQNRQGFPSSKIPLGTEYKIL